MKPEPFSADASSGIEKMPVRRPVPMNVPSVSKTSEIEKAKIVSCTSCRRPGVEMSEPKH